MQVMTGRIAFARLAAAGLLGLAMLQMALRVAAEEKTSAGQKLLAVDWADGEIAAFKAAPNKAAGADAAKLDALQIPVLAFVELPQIVKNVAGPNARPVKPRAIIFDAKQPYWYQIVDSYDGISVTVDADRRINHDVGPGFQIGAPNKGAEGTLGAKGKPRITILDNSQEEGMEGVIIEYTVPKFPDIPYTVTIECSTKAKSQCKDLAVVAKDEALLRLIAAGKK